MSHLSLTPHTRSDEALLCITRDGRIMMFTLAPTVTCKSQLVLGSPLLHCSAAAARLLSVVKSNGCVHHP